MREEIKEVIDRKLKFFPIRQQNREETRIYWKIKKQVYREGQGGQASGIKGLGGLTPSTQ